MCVCGGALHRTSHCTLCRAGNEVSQVGDKSVEKERHQQANTHTDTRPASCVSCHS